MVPFRDASRNVSSTPPRLERINILGFWAATKGFQGRAEQITAPEAPFPSVLLALDDLLFRQ